MAQARTIEQIRSLASRETGITLELYRGPGYLYFVHSTDTVYETHSVYVCALGHLTTEQCRRFAQHIREEHYQ